jgi:hypothetical protein
MSVNDRQSQRPNVFSFLLLLVLSSSCLAALFYFLSDIIPSQGATIPWVFVSFFMFPMLFILSLFQNVGEIRGLEEVTVSERNRLKMLVAVLRSRLIYALFTLFSFAIVAGFSLYLSSVKVVSIPIVLAIIGGMLGGEAVIIYALINLRNSVQDCKVDITKRMSDLKARRKIHQRLQINKKPNPQG